MGRFMMDMHGMAQDQQQIDIEKSGGSWRFVSLAIDRLRRRFLGFAHHC
jgi:hypothetical protein